MHHAATKGLLNMCQLLFSKGAHIDDLDDKRRTPLHCALQEGQISVAHYLLEMGANIQGAMHHASAKGLLDICQLLFSKGAHIDALDDKWHTPLHYALQEGQISVVHYLLKKGANPNLNYHRELTALHYFAAQGKLDVCQLLVSNGALIDVVDNRRCTPLHLALQEGQVSVANYLVEMGANVKGAMHHAAAKGLLDICKLLFSKGAHIDALDDKWHTPLHYALQEGQISVVRYLEKRANPDNSSDVSIQDRVNVADPGCLTAGADSDEDTPLVIDEQPGGTALRPYDVPLFKSPFLCPALCECWNVTAEVGKFTPQSSCSRPEEQKEPAPSSYESFSDVQSPPKLKRWVSKGIFFKI
ncbi:hypothetical protein QYM36_002928 [Artemia franciscana]|uniref:Uncharacterized protein n=1 Tax=Artemia franciscana TaxID=6661 RepID=A0AA88I723_ARTSF|nr:hypothetical protein QYM36_002928 [Artemia franciscana]